MNSQPVTTNVFVYGTLKPGESNYKFYCQGKTIAEIEAYTRGKLYHLAPGYPGMTAGNNKVKGYLLSFNSSNILNRLDWLENYQQDRTAQLNDYYRQQVPIYSLWDEPLGVAWCYLMSLDKIKFFRGQLLTSNSWNSNLFLN